MIALLQRVSEAGVQVNGETVGAIGRGLLVFVGVERGDDEATAERLVERVLTYRVFSDAEGRMNLDVLETGGEVLLVSQFTLAANTGKGRRASFTSAAEPAEGERLFERVVALTRERLGKVQTGRFGAHMKVALVNDGPVTFWLQVPPAA